MTVGNVIDLGHKLGSAPPVREHVVVSKKMDIQGIVASSTPRSSRSNAEAAMAKDTRRKDVGVAMGLATILIPALIAETRSNEKDILSEKNESYEWSHSPSPMDEKQKAKSRDLQSW
ncbi:hypothetical protein ETB97_002154 [Aspergillus alliaceus]|uniref:Uncharacterized protein n=1 Tax=Petromyces alliaceus TaxID=209559 RepID=A0A8H6A1R5_PETAA|nr:hypothetical protein ETB97_002154 [Aspergillus burnettii]